LVWKNIGIRKSEFVAKSQFLYHTHLWHYASIIGTGTGRPWIGLRHKFIVYFFTALKNRISKDSTIWIPAVYHVRKSFLLTHLINKSVRVIIYMTEIRLFTSKIFFRERMKKSSLCHKLWFSNLCNMMSHIIDISNYVYSDGSNNQSLKYLLFTPSGCKEKGISNFEFVTKTQFLLSTLRIWNITVSRVEKSATIWF